MGYWLSLSRALTAWTLRPHDPARLRRDAPALIAARLRGGSPAPVIAPPTPRRTGHGAPRPAGPRAELGCAGAGRRQIGAAGGKDHGDRAPPERTA